MDKKTCPRCVGTDDMDAHGDEYDAFLVCKNCGYSAGVDDVYEAREALSQALTKLNEALIYDGDASYCTNANLVRKAADLLEDTAAGHGLGYLTDWRRWCENTHGTLWMLGAAINELEANGTGDEV